MLLAKADGGFPETKILKQKIRNIIEPNRNLGHSDTPSSKVGRASNTVPVEREPIKPSEEAAEGVKPQQNDASATCEDCR